MWRPPALFVPWSLFAVLCCALMAASPGEETIPFHLGWITLCLSYGFALWPPAVTLLSTAVYAVASGAVLVGRASDGVIGWQETAEIPLMALMAFVMAWHVARRVESMRQLGILADAERVRHEERERLSRMYSHEMRTPLTIARGYVSLLQEEDLTGEQHEDLSVIDDELGTLERVGERLVRTLAVSDHQERRAVDVDALVDEVVTRWGNVTARNWVVDSDVGTFTCSRERVRMCLDTLVENALRYTDVDDTVRVFARRAGDTVELGVADSGPGLADDVVDAVNLEPRVIETLQMDVRRQTGLGLELVRQVAESRGGTIRAGRAAEGGAEITLTMPRTPLPPHPVSREEMNVVPGAPRMVRTRLDAGG
ncbi:HAMP domain-containing sensor histidine kinase [Nocardioides sp. CER19]|uniref:sensor histidine kinase n=1 Tax=Nocardioides sp. CER19 TaxID=3038538 RepID=UPI00244C3267|nr:HAMP domain-containing sensor histidine kinase [Nocardioides sp. CER19]MDH2413976.1 HAMP domain-containing sensor histidine kinase [Nocardioides sp. CER19]